MKRKLTARMRRLAPALGTFVFVSVFIELAVRAGYVKNYILPAPSEVISVLFSDREELLQAFLSTFSSAAAGLLLSILLGVLVAVLVSFSNFFRRAFLPYAIFFQTVPVVSIAPLLVIWFGFGKTTVIAAAFIVSVFPIIASSLLGLDSADPALLDIFKIYSASRFDLYRRLLLPGALPYIFSGIQIAAGLSVIGAIVGEFIAGGGLGAVVDAARTQQRVDIVFAAILLSSMIGIFFVEFVRIANHRLIGKWNISERKNQ